MPPGNGHATGKSQPSGALCGEGATLTHTDHRLTLPIVARNSALCFLLILERIDFAMVLRFPSQTIQQVPIEVGLTRKKLDGAPERLSSYVSSTTVTDSVQLAVFVVELEELRN